MANGKFLDKIKNGEFRNQPSSIDFEDDDMMDVESTHENICDNANSNLIDNHIEEIEQPKNDDSVEVPPVKEEIELKNDDLEVETFDVNAEVSGPINIPDPTLPQDLEIPDVEVSTNDIGVRPNPHSTSSDTEETSEEFLNRIKDAQKTDESNKSTDEKKTTEIESKPEETPVRRRGRAPRQDLQPVDVAETVLDFVCKKTIQGLIDTYKSEIYTEKFTNDLFNKYCEGNIDPTDPLFKELIHEVIQNKTQDSYLQDKTEIVLKHIIKE